ncbi:MAG: hypothetical protein DA408_00180 [Bacteroidetes bacterium]|nr:MAG: hypothetical protein C7N36_15275 [Bacteroidota bacterium]PTM15072.1 MAG: hypothetical protein DA408_00180 [Bacteroidota bacterium]
MLKIKITDIDKNALALKEIKYIFETLCLTIGTPWHFVPAHFTGPVDVYYGLNETVSARLYIKANPESVLKSKKAPRVFQESGITFMDFSDQPVAASYTTTSDNQVVLKNDIVYSLFYLIAGKSEADIPRNKLDQHDVFQSVLYKNNLLHTPVFNQYAELIAELFADVYEFAPRWKDGKKAALALSHDTDYPEMIKSIEILRYILTNRNKLKFSTIPDILSGKNHFWQFDNFIELEQAYGAKSAFYFCPLKGSLFRYFFIAPDPFYDTSTTKFKAVFKKLNDIGFETGLHSSYFAYQSLASFKKEKEKLQEEAGFEIVGNRHHYWHLNQDDPSETAFIHQESGLFYDSSLSFEKHSGFRYSICTPFNLWHKTQEKALSILQLPPTLMDDHLFGHARNHSFATFKEHIDSLVQSVADYRGVFVADFHARVLNTTFFPQWGEAYQYLLEAIAAREDFYIDTPINICKYWQERMTHLKNQAKDEVSGVYQR